MSSEKRPDKYLVCLALILLLPVAGIFYFFDPERLVLFPKCPLYVFTGLYCPGCGSQRAIHSMLHLRISDAFHYNLLLIPAFAFILYHLLRPFFSRLLNINLPDLVYNRRTPWIIFFIVVIFWILRNIRMIPFTWLAPV